MILGPVFHAELVTTSRRRRYYLARFLYGLALLALVGWTYEEEIHSSPTIPEPTYAFLARMASGIFATFLMAQVAAVLCLTPAIVAGTIADERQRKTLPYLLTSRLSSLEIVVGKLAARMLQVVVLVLTGLPIMSILSLFGGLDPPLVVAAFAGTLTTAFALAGLSILVSSAARRARDAIVTTYLLLALWLAGVPIVRALIDPTSARLAGWLARLARPFEILDPFQLAHLADPTPGLATALVRMSGLQVALGVLFVGLAVWRIRRTPANFDRGGSAESWSRRPASPSTRAPGVLSRLFGRPPVGDDPMAWKERYVARAGPALRAVGLLTTVFAVVFLGDVLLDLGRPAFAELALYGYGDAATVVHKARDELNETLAFAAAAACAIWVVGLAGTAAAGQPSEREGDTWISLIGTTLTGGEILRGKALGALRRWRIAGLAAFALWTFGLVAGAIHPLGYALTLALFAAYTAFALALGSFLGLRARSTARAMAATIAVLFVLNGGYLLCLFPFAGRLDELWLTAPVMPFVIDLAPERYAPVQVFFGTYPADNINLRLDTVVARLLTCAVSLVFYAAATAGLAIAAVDGFDRAADRPRRPPGFSAALAESIEQDIEAGRDEPEAVVVGPDA
jgi:ABC-type transport system involved in multi-copper enzyme maturation permease subunit